VSIPTAIIGLAHGSRHPGVSGPIDELMERTSSLIGLPARAAYLDLTEPDLMTVAGDLTRDGFERGIVVPLLFTQAFHARTDVPAAVAEAASTTGLALVTTQILGTGDDIARALVAEIDSAQIPAGLPVLLYAVGSSDRTANDAVEELGKRLAERRRTPVAVAFGTAAPRAEQVSATFARDRRIAVVPLFVSPGLLLDPMARLARDRGWPMTSPLGRRLAPVVAARVSGRVRPDP
jgi:sirohydrochlorin ferrochelatase